MKEIGFNQTLLLTLPILFGIVFVFDFYAQGVLVNQPIYLVVGITYSIGFIADRALLFLIYKIKISFIQQEESPEISPIFLIFFFIILVILFWQTGNILLVFAILILSIFFFRAVFILTAFIGRFSLLLIDNLKRTIIEENQVSSSCNDDNNNTIIKASPKINRSSEKLLSRVPTDKKEKSKNINKLLIKIDEMDGHSFEYFVANLLETIGYTDVKVTVGSSDFGVDITCKSQKTTWAVQCKRYKGHVDRKAVSDVVAGKYHYGCTHTMVVTNSYFSPKAKEFSQSTGCVLIDRTGLAQLIQRTDLSQLNSFFSS